MNKLFVLPVLISWILGQSIQNPVSISATVDGQPRAGEVVQVRINATMDEEWHIYSIYKTVEGTGPLQTEISIGGTAIGAVAPVREPVPIHTFDPGFEMDTYYHSGNTLFTVPVRIKRNLEPGTYSIATDVYFQVCNVRLCYPPITKSDTLQITVVSGEPRTDRMSFSAAVGSSNDSSDSDGKGDTLLGLLLLAVGGAILSWVMPCVYPMIPIIISFFGKLSDEKHVGRNMVATFYGLGISGTFVIIGLIVGVLSWGVSDIASKSRYANIGNLIATNAWINLALGILFIFFALWMFGIVNVNVAGRLLNKTDQAGQSAKSAYVGSFLLGVTFAITSFSCTVPVVGTLLVVATAGTAGGILTSLYGMLIYGVVFAVPFVALSLFPTALERLPRSGIWMETLKIVFGFIELIAAIKFLWVPDLEWNIGFLPRNVVLILFIIIGIAQIAYLMGFYTIGSSEKIKPFQIGKGRIVGIALTILVFSPIVLSLAEAPTYHYANMPRVMNEVLEALLPPPPTEDDLAKQDGWFVDEYDEALAKAKADGKPLFIDFTGVYCANCRVMERRVFPEKSVKEQLDKMVLTRLYVDKKDSLSQVYAQLQYERYHQATQPYYVILDPADEFALADTGGYMPNGFSDFLKDGVASYNERNRSDGP